MLLYKAGAKPVSPRVERKRETLSIQIEEMPERPKFQNRTARERRKFITKVEKIVRSSKEYRTYVKYLKEHFDMEHCEVFTNVRSNNGKKYTIEIHHEPFQLSWITDTVLSKHEDLGETLDPYLLADEIMGLHYAGQVGLLPLSKTAHELVTNDRIAIPLQLVYQNYHQFALDYDIWIPEYVRDLVKLKMELSLKSAHIQSDVIVDPTVTYVDVEGYEFPEVPPEWANALARQRQIESATPEPTEEEMQGAIPAA